MSLRYTCKTPQWQRKHCEQASTLIVLLLSSTQYQEFHLFTIPDTLSRQRQNWTRHNWKTKTKLKYCIKANTFTFMHSALISVEHFITV